MTRNDRFIRELETYLVEYEGSTPLPNSVRDAVRAQLPQTKQIGPVSGTLRDIYMNSSMDTPARWGLVAAVVIGAVIIGGALFFGGGGVGTSPTPTPSPSEPASEAAVPSPAEPADLAAYPGGGLRPGDYYFSNIPGVRVVFTVGTGWERNVPDNVIWTVEDHKATMAAGTIANLYVDPCQPELGLLDPPVGPTVDDLAAALGAVPGYTLSAPVEVTQDGVSGVRIDYDSGDWAGDCAPVEDAFSLGVNDDGDDIGAPYGDDPISYFIYDVDGTRVVIAAGLTAQREDDLNAVLDSIRFE
jgi:hypothetical protein